MSEPAQAVEEAVRAGFDLTLVDASLAIPHTERARKHDQALALVLELDRIRRERDGHAERSAAAAR